MPAPTVSKLPELTIFGGPLPKSQFSTVSAAIFYANGIPGNIWPSVNGQVWLPMSAISPVTFSSLFELFHPIWRKIKPCNKGFRPKWFEFLLWKLAL